MTSSSDTFDVLFYLYDEEFCIMVIYLCGEIHGMLRFVTIYVGTKGVLQLCHLSFDDNKLLKLSIGYAKSLFKCTRPLSKIYS